MSPDPQRTEEEINSGTVYFMAVPDDEEEDDFMADPNGQYELDFSSHESEFSDDEETNDNLQATITTNPPPLPSNNNNGTETGEEEVVVVNGRMMARYQLLIPFPTATQDPSTTEEEEGDDEVVVQVSSQVSIDNNNQQQQIESQPQQQSSTLSSSTPSKDEIPTARETCPSESRQQREILLNEDKVEVIKNAMKGFTLPGVPPWAQEIDENSWKETLFDLTKKSTSSASK